MWSRNAMMTIKPGVASAESNGEVLLLDEARDRVFGIAGPAAEAFVLLEAGVSFEDAVGELVSRYDAAPEVVEHDLREVLDRMIANDVIAMS